MSSDEGHERGVDQESGERPLAAAALSVISDGIVILFDDGRVEALNAPGGDRVCRLSGVASAPTSLPVDARLLGLVSSARRGDVARADLAADGAVFEATVAASASLGGAVIVLRDVTEDRAREAALQAVELRLHREILGTQERERQRVGQELHDGVCQHLGGARFLAQRLAAKLEGVAAADATEVANALDEALHQVRAVSRGLCPVTLNDDEGLHDALLDLASRTERIFGTHCEVTREGQGSVRDEDANHLFRIAQEAVTNAVKHGKATRVRLHLTMTDEVRLSMRTEGAGPPQLQLATTDEVRLVIEDDGVGFAPGPLPPPGNGTGMHLMQRRGQAMGARVTFGRATLGGARVVCELSSSSRRERSQ